MHGQWTTHAAAPGQNSTQAYAYDSTGRLTQVQDTANGVCTTRAYTFDNNTNRTAQTTAAALPGAACTTGGTTTTHAYDTADRLVDTGYTYDALGRTTAQPNGTTTAYHANDLVQQQTAGTNRQTWTLDPALRFRGWTTETNNAGTWTQTGTKLNHYDSDSDNPRWTVENTTTGALTRNVDSPVGDLGATTAQAGSVVLQLTNLHGDVAVALPLTPGQAPQAFDADEYGNPKTAPIGRYGWLGAKQRSTETPTGNTLMGVRLYDPATGRFLSVDPVPGGNANAYEYVHADPLTQYDLDGKKCWVCGKVKSAVKKTYTYVKNNRGWIVSGAAVGACVAFSWGTCALAGAGAYLYNEYQKPRNQRWNLRYMAFTAVTIGWGAKVGFLTRSVRFASRWGKYAFNGLYAAPSGLCWITRRC